jgi:hypothetical protein
MVGGHAGRSRGRRNSVAPRGSGDRGVPKPCTQTTPRPPFPRHSTRPRRFLWGSSRAKPEHAPLAPPHPPHPRPHRPQCDRVLTAAGPAQTPHPPPALGNEALRVGAVSPGCGAVRTTHHTQSNRRRRRAARVRLGGQRDESVAAVVALTPHQPCGGAVPGDDASKQKHKNPAGGEGARRGGGSAPRPSEDRTLRCAARVPATPAPRRRHGGLGAGAEPRRRDRRRAATLSSRCRRDAELHGR